MQTSLRGFAALLLLAGAAGAQTAIGLFESSGDVGVNPKPGSAAMAAGGGEYSITGGGANVWGTADAMHFVWKRVTGDVTLSANVRFLGEGVNAHRKAMLMIRQDLTPGSAYADVALHGDGLTSLQFRPTAGEATKELRSEVKAPAHLRIERRGNAITIQVGKNAESLTATGPQTVELGAGPVYVGLAVCSHDAEVLETAVFSDVRLEQRPPQPRYRSKIAIYDLAARTTKVIHTGDGVIEAPNWSRDGASLLVNTQGNLYRIAVSGEGGLQKIELSPGGPYRCNNDHDYSPDGKWIAFSASSPQSRQSQVYLARAGGSEVKLLTPASPSYFHGWSPDGKRLAFVGQRNGRYELFSVGPEGGAEQHLTAKGAYDDGPDYSPDGKWIYFNSDRDNGAWNIWRIPASGGGGEGDAKAERITNDEWEDWFPHVSPNGKRIVLFSFPKGTKGHNDRMEGVALRLIAAPGKKVKAAAKAEVLTTFFGGQGTINVNSWSPDSRRFAFVIYEVVK